MNVVRELTWNGIKRASSPLVTRLCSGLMASGRKLLRGSASSSFFFFFNLFELILTQDTALEGLLCWKLLENNTDRMHLSQQCHQLTHVSICERMTVFYLDSRDLLLTQNSTGPALGAEVRIEPHALQKQETASVLVLWCCVFPV